MNAAELLDHSPITKGKYKGKTPNQISELDPSYLVWAYKNWSPKPCSKLLADSCREDGYDPDEGDAWEDRTDEPHF